MENKLVLRKEVLLSVVTYEEVNESNIEERMNSEDNYSANIKLLNKTTGEKDSFKDVKAETLNVTLLYPYAFKDNSANFIEDSIVEEQPSKPILNEKKIESKEVEENIKSEEVEVEKEIEEVEDLKLYEITNNSTQLNIIYIISAQNQEQAIDIFKVVSQREYTPGEHNIYEYTNDDLDEFYLEFEEGDISLRALLEDGEIGVKYLDDPKFNKEQ